LSRLLSFLPTRRPSTLTLFPYTTLFRSKPDDLHVARVVAARHQIVFGPDEIESDQARFRADQRGGGGGLDEHLVGRVVAVDNTRSEEHTSELQSRVDLVCRLLLEKKKKT